MTLDEAKEFVRIHSLTGKSIHASVDGQVFIDIDPAHLSELEKQGHTLMQVFPELPSEPTEKKSKKDKE